MIHQLPLGGIRRLRQSRIVCRIQVILGHWAAMAQELGLFF